MYPTLHVLKTSTREVTECTRHCMYRKQQQEKSLSVPDTFRQQLDIFDYNWNIAVMIGTLLYVFGSCERRCKLTEEMHIPLRRRLVGIVVRRPPRERKVPGSNPACAGIFSGSSHTCDLNIGTPVATLPGAWRYKVSTGTGRPGVSIL